MCANIYAEKAVKLVKDPLVLKDYISRIYQAVLRPNLMGEVFNDLRQVIDAPYGGYQVENTYTHNLLHHSLHGFEESYFPNYKEHYIKCEPWTLQGLKLGLTDTPFLPSQRLLADKEYRESEFYQDWGRHFGIRHAIGTSFSLDDGYIFKANFQRHEDQPVFDLEIEHFLNLLRPHLNQFVKLSAVFEGGGEADNSWQQALKYLSRPVWVVNNNMRLVFSNHCAEQWMGQGQYLTSRNAKLMAQDSSQNKALQSVVMKVQGMKDGLADLVLDDRQNNRITLGDSSNAENFWVSPVTDEMGYTNKLVMITGRKTLPGVDLLKSLHGLTQRQAQVCLLLMQGHSLQESAEKLNISINTVRNTLASSFRTLNVKSQSSLIRLLFDNFSNV